MRANNKLTKGAAKLTSNGISSLKKIEEAELAMTTRSEGAIHAPVALSAVSLNPLNLWNSDDDEEGILQLADAIRRNGLLHNIVVSQRDDGTLLLLSGERRVRALQLLRAEELAAGEGKKPKWAKVQAEIFTGLEPLDEIIILDEANIMARGNAGDVSTMSKCISRYIENLKKKYDLSEGEAEAILRKKTSLGRSSIYRYLQVAHDLKPQLIDLMEGNHIYQNQAIALCALEEREQEQVIAAVELARSLAGEDSEQRNRLISEVIRRAVEAAGMAEKAAREKALNGLTENLLPKAAPKAEKGTPEAVVAQKTRYVERYRKMAAELRKLSDSKRRVKVLRQLEEAEDSCSIVDSLEELAGEIDQLLRLMKEDKG